MEEDAPRDVPQVHRDAVDRTIGAVVITDGRLECLGRTLESLMDRVTPAFMPRLLVDDTEHQLGFAGAVREAWRRATEAGWTHLLHLEDDFTFNEGIDLDKMADLLDANEHLAQLVLKRQPWSPEEQSAGGIVEKDPDDFTDCGDFTEHERFFSTNPSLVPRHVFTRYEEFTGEEPFTRACIESGLRFAFLGGRDDPPKVTHIGAQRNGGWYPP